MKAKEKNPAEKKWEVKDRFYHLLNKRTPLTYTINTKHSRRKPLLYYDEETNTQRELRYATNQNSCFVDEQKGQVTLGHVTFEDGVLMVPKRLQALQKLLSMYHPNRNKTFKEKDSVVEASNDLAYLEYEAKAMMTAFEVDIDQAEAILRVEMGSNVNKMSSKEIKRDLILLAKSNPVLFLELAEDENVMLRNFAIKAKEAGIIKLSQDNRTFNWGSNGKKLLTIPFDENPYSAMAAWFQTDEGLEVYKSIEKKFS
tara:strand:+ start:1273 stop:2040 length:768 start_codon:yes stop_codon:yes gene_type:complete